MSPTERGVAVRRVPILAVDVVGALHVVGTLVAYLSLSVLLPIGFAIGYSEEVWPFVAAGAIMAAIGLGVRYTTRERSRS